MTSSLNGRLPPLAGLTGVKTPDEVRMVEDAFRESGLSIAGYRLMIGVLGSDKTLSGELTNPRYPMLAELDAIREAAHPASLLTLHYNTRDMETKKVMRRIMELVRRLGATAVQLNVSREIAAGLAARWTRPLCILQANRSWPSDPENMDHAFRMECRSRFRRTSYALIDGSGGHGTPFDETSMRAAVYHLGHMFGGISVAGGLTPDRMKDPTLRRYLPKDVYLGFDVESSVRTADDTALDPEKVYAFFCAAKKMVGIAHAG